MHSTAFFAKLEQLIRRDPARRGLLAGGDENNLLCRGELAHAARHLAQEGKSVAIVTGFFVPRATPPASETDGPPGAIILALALESIGIATRIWTDEFCFGGVRACAIASDYPVSRIRVFDENELKTPPKVANLADGKDLSHLVAVERIGPNHTAESLIVQSRRGQPPLAEFERQVPDEARNLCHNMFGASVNECSPPLYQFFENPDRFGLRVRTIGIGDGGNEIGMGRIPWEDISGRLARPDAPLSARIPCRIATDWTIVAGTSNWGAYALAAGVLFHRDACQRLLPWDVLHQEQVLSRMVREGPAVDGVTALAEPTVDGLPTATFLQTWIAIRKLVGLPE